MFVEILSLFCLILLVLVVGLTILEVKTIQKIDFTKATALIERVDKLDLEQIDMARVQNNIERIAAGSAKVTNSLQKLCQYSLFQKSGLC